MTAIRVTLPGHLRDLAGVRGEVRLELDEPATIGAVLDGLEARHPVLRGTVREHGTASRRAYIRFFACGRDLSHAAPDAVLPEPVLAGEEPLRIVGAIAGG